MIGGVPEGYDAYFLVKKIQEIESPILHIARDDKRVREIKSALKFFDEKINIIEFPAWDCLPYDRVSPNSNIVGHRASTLYQLSSGIDKYSLIITTVNSISQRVPSSRFMKKFSMRIKLGENLNLDNLKNFLLESGYKRVPTVFEKCEFSIRGGIIDIFPSNREIPVRLEFFGDTVDQVRLFDPLSQRTESSLKEILLASASEIILNQESINSFRIAYRKNFGAMGQEDPLYEAISAGKYFLGYEHWGPFFYKKMDTLFDYLPDISVSMDNNTENVLVKRSEMVGEQYLGRLEAKNKKSNLNSAYNPAKPELLYLDLEEINSNLKNRDVFLFRPLPLPSGPRWMEE